MTRDWKLWAPEDRNLFLLHRWENDNTQAVCLPDAPSIHFSTKCAERAYAHVGLPFTRALVDATYEEWRKQ